MQVELLQQLELNAAALLLRTEHLRRAVTTIACQYRSFFTWLLTTIKQLEGQDPAQEDSSSGISTHSSLPLATCQEVLTFLKGQFLHDLIGPELEVSCVVVAMHELQCMNSAACCRHSVVGLRLLHRVDHEVDMKSSDV